MHHIGMVVSVALVWAANFIILKIGLETISPLLFSAIRFTFAAVPAIFLIPRNNVPWHLIIKVGVFLGTTQFGLLIWGMNIGLSAGVASLVLQSQILFTIALSMWFCHEKVSRIQLLGTLITGIFLVRLGSEGDWTFLGFLLVCGAGFAWAIANVEIKKESKRHKINMLSLMVWQSAIPPIPFLLAAIFCEDVNVGRVISVTGIEVACTIYSGLVCTVLAFAVWGRLIERYTPAKIAPFSLLVPVFTIIFSYFTLGETISVNDAINIVAIIIGMLLMVVNLKKLA